MKKSSKLMWKIFGFLIGFSAILLSVLWIMETMLLDKMYENIRKNEIKKAIILIEENIDSPDLNQIIMMLQDDSEIIVTPKHSFVPPKRPNPSDRPPLRQAITEERDFVTADGKIKSFVFYAMISPVNATISTIKVQLYYVTGIMIFLSIILAFIMAKTVSKPIEKLNNAAKLLASGDYNIHFTGTGYREIHELSDTLNYTASELSKVEDLRRELMANISHDLRTPLALIYSHAEMMHDFPEEITGEQTEVIMDETTRLSNLVSDIFDVSQLEIGTMELNKETYNITNSILKTIDRTSKLVEKYGYKIVFEGEEDVYIRGDEIKITQAFYNLLINAIHYSGEDLNINVRQIVEGNRIRIEVEDHGIGIEEENLPHIWDRYYKIDKIHRRAIVGTGLGLSIVKKIIEMHGGDYGVKSQTGKGSIFWFSLETLDIEGE
jgi:signal transduction histidine kinase